MQRKYEFTGEELAWKGHMLRRIRRLADGMVGGWIEREGNLYHEGLCWVKDEAKVYGYAEVHGNARVGGDARVCGSAVVVGDARVSGNAKVCGRAVLTNAYHVRKDMVCTITPFLAISYYHSILICDNKIEIGCYVLTLEEWMERKEELGAEHRYSARDIAYYEAIIVPAWHAHQARVGFHQEG